MRWRTPADGRQHQTAVDGVPHQPVCAVIDEPRAVWWSGDHRQVVAKIDDAADSEGSSRSDQGGPSDAQRQACGSTPGGTEDSCPEDGDENHALEDRPALAARSQVGE